MLCGFVVGALRIVLGVLVEDLGLAGHAGGLFHLGCACVTAHSVAALCRCAFGGGIHTRLAADHLDIGCVVVADFSGLVVDWGHFSHASS